MLMGFEEIDGDDDFQEEFACPFCAESYDIIGLCCHIDDEHTLESKNAVCPVCSLKVGVDIVAHITLHHGTKEKVTKKRYQFDTFTSSERTKRRRSTKSSPAPRQTKNVSEDKQIERKRQVFISPVSLKDREERRHKSEFVQRLLSSAIFDEV
ncbi:unnamed protein product [Arabidopsis thaliana]|uniref:(thale cress) hypothetical protein n=1 Tax=Arabidopsis thaliana TaxID=3702 RepID=A0A7G2E510_ARATH|nr:unnamed protein product [Arabidopsis thaliana]